MCKSLIYTANTTPLAATVGAPINIGTTVRRIGNGIIADETSFRLRDAGYYDITVSATFTAAAPGDVTIAVYRDGVPIIGAEATETVTTANVEYRSVTVPTTVRVHCNHDSAMITIIPETTAPTITNLAVQIEKV